jgi:tRNA dimethylallyltransferase
MFEPPARDSSDRGFGAKGDAQASGGQHRQIVGSIADRDGLCQRDGKLGGERNQGLPLGLASDDRRQYLAGDAVVDHLQTIGDDAVETEFARDPIGKNREPASDECGCSAVSPHRRDQDARSRGQADPPRCLFEDRRVDPGQQANAGLERGDKVDLPVHRSAGNFGNARADAEHHAKFVEHFVFDDRRFEIGDEQPLAPLSRRLDQKIDRSRADGDTCGPADRRRVRGIDDEIAGLTRCEPDRLGLDRERLGDRSGEAGKAVTGSAGNQGDDDAHHHPSYAGDRISDKRPAVDAGLASPAVVIAGPTASGKSALALELAEAFGGTVINADSLQCYRELEILTARPAPADCVRVPHRLYGFLDAAERGSVASWRGLALAEIASATTAGRLPIVVGGTGLYLRALALGLAPFPEVPEAVRQKALALHRALGGAAFRQQLAALDADSARRLPAGDTQRLVRAYEVVRATGIPIGAWRCQPNVPPAYRFATILLMPPRERLYAACDARFAAMIEKGALAEAARVAALGLASDLPAMKAVGLPELLRYLRGEMSFADMVAEAQRATRRYAKRQLTWFRHQIAADLILDAQFSESLLRCSRQFIDGFLLTG